MHASFEMDVSHHVIAVSERGGNPPAYFPTGDDLVESGAEGAVIKTGIHTGVVHVELDARLTPLTEDPAGEWEEVTETTFGAPTGDVILQSFMGEPAETPTLTLAGPGAYRLRVHASGRGIDPDGTAFEPFERYHVAVWPETDPTA